MNVLGELWVRRELLRSLIARNLKIRYKGSTLGFFWSLMDPLLMVLVYFIFAKLTRFQTDLPYLLSGVLTWQFVGLCVGDSFHVVIGNTSLVKKVFFPRQILPLATAIANLINFFLTLLVLISFLLVSGVKMHPAHFVYLPIFILLEFILCLGFTFLFSSLTVYFRDTQHLVSIGLMAWFFLSPVIYPLQLVPERYLWIYLLNPMCTVLIGFRACLMGSPFIWSLSTGISVVIACIILITGLWTFLKLEPYFADEL